MAAVPSAPPMVPGLKRLIQEATVVVHQTKSGYSANTGNRYNILSKGDVLFTMHEDVPGTFRGGVKRAFLFDGVENTGRTLFWFHRRFISDAVELYIDDQLASVICMEKTFMTPIFIINDPLQQPVIRLKGKMSNTSTFELQTNAKVPIGSIQKPGFPEKFFSSNDHFLINFPADLAVQYKLAVIVACVHIGFRF